jgi:ABC-type Fe3+ transport system permease subunit
VDEKAIARAALQSQRERERERERERIIISSLYAFLILFCVTNTPLTLHSVALVEQWQVDYVTSNSGYSQS